MSKNSIAIYQEKGPVYSGLFSGMDGRKSRIRHSFENDCSV